MWNMERIGLTASEEMSSENVDGRPTDAGRRIPVYTEITESSRRNFRNAFKGEIVPFLTVEFKSHDCEVVTEK